MHRRRRPNPWDRSRPPHLRRPPPRPCLLNSEERSPVPLPDALHRSPLWSARTHLRKVQFDDSTIMQTTPEYQRNMLARIPRLREEGAAPLTHIKIIDAHLVIRSEWS